MVVIDRLEEVYWKERVVWSPGYFVSTVGLNEKQITEYVKWQGGQDSGQASLDLKSATGYARGYLEPPKHYNPLQSHAYC